MSESGGSIELFRGLRFLGTGVALSAESQTERKPETLFPAAFPIHQIFEVISE